MQVVVFNPPMHYTTNNYIANLYVTWPEKTSLMCTIKYFILNIQSIVTHLCYNSHLSLALQAQQFTSFHRTLLQLGAIVS